MRLPSVKTLAQITAWPREARKVLESRSDETERLLTSELPIVKGSTFGGFERTRTWVTSCYHRPSYHNIRMSMLDELCETYGVELIPKGHNSKSPSIEYLNAGDTYAATLLYVRGRYIVGCWGDIVERGHYD